MKSSEARALSRVYVSDKQVKAWSDCMKSGGVLLVASYPNQTAFPLKVSWSPPETVGHGTMEIALQGGLIDKKSKIADRFTGKSNRSYIVSPLPNAKQIVITANISGLSDELWVDLTPRVVIPPPAPPPAVVENVALDVILCSRANCELKHIRDGRAKEEWQVVKWEKARGTTKQLGPQLSLPDSVATKVFCKPLHELTAGELAGAVRSADFTVTDNAEQAKFFDFDNVPRSSYFDYEDAGRIYFFDSIQNDAEGIDHHLRLNVMFSFLSTCRGR